LAWDVVPALRDEIEAGPKSELALEFHELAALVQAGPAFNIMGEDEGKLLSAGPARPALGGPLRTGQDGPHIADPPALSEREPAANLPSDSDGNQGLDAVI